jgi:hypothetical protein
MALRYRQFGRLSNGEFLRAQMRLEIGATPTQTPDAYDRRSPLHFVRAIARSGVPLQIWWSVRDRLVVDQRLHSGRVYSELKRLHPRARVTEVVGTWPHKRQRCGGTAGCRMRSVSSASFLNARIERYWSRCGPLRPHRDSVSSEAALQPLEEPAPLPLHALESFPEGALVRGDDRVAGHVTMERGLGCLPDLVFDLNCCCGGCHVWRLLSIDCSVHRSGSPSEAGARELGAA